MSPPLATPLVVIIAFFIHSSFSRIYSTIAVENLTIDMLCRRPDDRTLKNITKHLLAYLIIYSVTAQLLSNLTNLHVSVIFNESFIFRVLKVYS